MSAIATDLFDQGQYSQLTCVSHPSSTAALFCETCEEMACSRCIITVHDDHTLSDLTNIIQKKERQLNEEKELEQIRKFMAIDSGEKNSINKHWETKHFSSTSDFQNQLSNYGNNEVSIIPTHSFPQYRLLPQTMVLSEFPLLYSNTVYSVCPTGDGGAWLCYFFSNTVTLIDKTGVIHQKIQYKEAVTDISVSPVPSQHEWESTKLKHTKHLWSCCGQDYSIMECCTCSASELPILRFKTDKHPKCLCVTKDNHVIVGMENEISKFTTGGNIVLSTRSSKSNAQQLVGVPQKLAECHVTQNIAVLYRNWSGDNYKYKSHVLILTEHFQTVFRYRGSKMSESSYQLTQRRSYQFDPVDVQYDNQGNLIIGDRHNHCLHLVLINGTGQFTRILYTDTLPNQAIGISKDNILWAVFDDINKKQVKLLQYSEEI